MLRQDQLDVGLARITGFLGIGTDDHSFFYRVVAGCQQAVIAFHFHHADPAGADLIDVFQKTERWDLDPGHFGSVQDRCPFRHGDALSVDRTIHQILCHHFASRPPLNIPYPK